MCYLPLGGAAEMVNKGPSKERLNIFSFLTMVEFFLMYIDYDHKRKSAVCT